jgi:uncharacterized protein YerC
MIYHTVMKIRPQNLTREQKIETLDALYTAASNVKGRQAVKSFLKDLLTESERIMLGRRIIIARKLIAGESYAEIIESLAVGKDTIAKVDRWLKDQFPGFEQAIAGLEAEMEQRQEKYNDRVLYATSALYRLKKKYPLHFLLFPWPKRGK